MKGPFKNGLQLLLEWSSVGSQMDLLNGLGVPMFDLEAFHLRDLFL